MNITPKEEVVPLTPQAFHILLALAHKPMYGYGITQQCEFDAEGSVAFDNGSVYRTMHRLHQQGFIRPLYEQFGQGSPHHRKFFELTPAGRTILAFESDRLRSLHYLARHRLRAAA